MDIPQSDEVLIIGSQVYALRPPLFYRAVFDFLTNTKRDKWFFYAKTFIESRYALSVLEGTILFYRGLAEEKREDYIRYRTSWSVFELEKSLQQLIKLQNAIETNKHVKKVRMY